MSTRQTEILILRSRIEQNKDVHGSTDLRIFDDLVGSLQEALEFIEDQEDVVDGSYGVPAPNRAMSLAQQLRDTLGEPR